MTPEAFAVETGVSRETLNRLKVYADLIAKWQKAINLVSAGDLDDLWRRHMLDSAQLIEHMPPAPQGRERVIVDLGSGAGFPGIVLAILGAGQVHLIESDQRKCTFLLEAARLTGSPAMIHNSRIEDFPKKNPDFKADIVTARGLAPVVKLLEYAAPLLAADGVCLFLKGGSLSKELTQAGKEWNMRADQLPSRTNRSGIILRLGDLARGRAKS